MPKVDSGSILQLFPHLDCSLCGNPTCEAMARRVFSDEQSYLDCPVLTPVDKKKIEDRLSKRSKLNNYFSFSEPIVELQPCAEYGKITLESMVHRPHNSLHQQLFAPCEMCALFQDVSFEKARCSKVMGYAYLEIEEKAIHIFNSGKIIIRRANDRDDAIKTLEEFENILWPAVVCTCGSPFSDCLGGGCPSCGSQACAALEWGIKQDSLSIDSAGMLLNNVSNQLIEKALHKMDTIVEELGNVLEDPQNIDKNQITDKRKLFQSLLLDLIKIGTKGMMESTNTETRLQFVCIHSLERNFRRVIEGVFSSIDNAEIKDLKYCYSFVQEGYQALKDNNRKFAEEIVNKYQKFMKEHELSQISPDFFKIITNGCNFARSCLFQLQ